MAVSLLWKKEKNYKNTYMFREIISLCVYVVGKN
jgi:hypothetical protein